jgi:hypothetical protein
MKAVNLTVALIVTLAQLCGLAAAVLGTGAVAWAGVGVVLLAAPVAVEAWGSAFGADEDLDDEFEAV